MLREMVPQFEKTLAALSKCPPGIPRLTEDLAEASRLSNEIIFQLGEECPGDADMLRRLCSLFEGFDSLVASVLQSGSCRNKDLALLSRVRAESKKRAAAALHFVDQQQAAADFAKAEVLRSLTISRP